jgi:hypothetical protein
MCDIIIFHKNDKKKHHQQYRCDILLPMDNT